MSSARLRLRPRKAGGEVMMLQENMLQRNRYDQETMISLSVDVDGKYDRSLNDEGLFRRRRRRMRFARALEHRLFFFLKRILGGQNLFGGREKSECPRSFEIRKIARPTNTKTLSCDTRVCQN